MPWRLILLFLTRDRPKYTHSSGDMGVCVNINVYIHMNIHKQALMSIFYFLKTKTISKEFGAIEFWIDNAGPKYLYTVYFAVIRYRRHFFSPFSLSPSLLPFYTYNFFFFFNDVYQCSRGHSIKMMSCQSHV